MGSRGIAYLHEHKELEEYLDKAGLMFMTDEAYGIAYTNIKKFHSAYYFFKRMEPEMEKNASPFIKSDFYSEFGKYYRTSPRTIRALGFFSFIFLFEFIILLADRQIRELTHEEPWKVLLIKVGLAAILLPLHHWLEHTVIHYLTSRKKISRSGGPDLR